MYTDSKNFTIFVLEILLKYQVTIWGLKKYICGPIKKLIFFPEIKKKEKKKFNFPWNEPLTRNSNQPEHESDRMITQVVQKQAQLYRGIKSDALVTSFKV